MEELEASHGGTGAYRVRTLMTSEFSSPIKYIRELRLDPGSSIGMHPHIGDEEIYYIISGSGTMMVDGETAELSTGDVVLTKSGSSHGLKNTSDAELVIFVACAAYC
jgi:mannose-6-phosphate isomerase-like protein (cupin superfamily)